MRGKRSPAARVLGALGIGRLAYYTWYLPRNRMADLVRDGGPRERRRTALGRQAMDAAVDQIPPLPRLDPDHVATAPRIYFMTGRKYWTLTAFCFASLAHHAGTPLVPVIHDDGTIDPELAARIRRLFPDAEIITAAEAMRRIDTALPRDRFPVIRANRDIHPTFGKLVDVHVGGDGWKMFLDSDMLFFRRPDVLLQWLRDPRRPFYMLDTEESYGWSRGLLQSLADGPLPRRLNVGMLGLNSSQIDWEWMERTLARMVEEEGSKYYVDQALGALLVAGRDCDVAPPEDYVVLPNGIEGRQPRAVLHHYVAGSKRWYFQHGWRIVQAQLGEAG